MSENDCGVPLKLQRSERGSGEPQTDARAALLRSPLGGKRGETWYPKLIAFCFFFLFSVSAQTSKEHFLLISGFCVSLSLSRLILVGCDYHKLACSTRTNAYQRTGTDFQVMSSSHDKLPKTSDLMKMPEILL